MLVNLGLLLDDDIDNADAAINDTEKRSCVEEAYVATYAKVHGFLTQQIFYLSFKGMFMFIHPCKNLFPPNFRIFGVSFASEKDEPLY